MFIKLKLIPVATINEMLAAHVFLFFARSQGCQMLTTNAQEPGYLPFSVKALYDYAGQSSNEIALISGQIYEVVATDGKGLWWQSVDKSGKQGWFPANFCEVLPKGPVFNNAGMGAAGPTDFGEQIRKAIQQQVAQSFNQGQQGQQQGGFGGRGGGIQGMGGSQQGGFGGGRGGGGGIYAQLLQQQSLNNSNNQLGGQFGQLQRQNQQSPGMGSGFGMGGGFSNRGGNSLLPGLNRPRFGAVLSLDQKKEFIEKGFIVVKNVIPKEILNRALRAINRVISSPPDPNSIVPKEISSCPELMTSKALADLLNATPAYEYADQLIGGANHCRGCQIALRYPGHGCMKAQLKKHGLDGMIENLGQASPFIGGIVNQVLGSDDEDSNYRFGNDWDKYWHIDGFPDAIKQLKTGEVKNFTMLLGIYLSDVSEPFWGNLCAHPGSHRQLEQLFREKGGVIKFLEGEAFEGIKLVHENMKDKIAPVEQILVNAGDIVLAHYQTAHSIAPNISPHIRYCVYFRLHHASHQIDQGKPDCLTNIWADYEGIRDLAHEMYPPPK